MSKNEKKLQKLNNSEKNVDEDNISQDKNDISNPLDNFPTLAREEITRLIQVTSGSNPNPILDKFNEQHIDKFLDNAKLEDEHSYKFASSNRWFLLLYIIIGCILFVFLIVYLLPNNKELLVDIFKVIIVFLGGLGSGYGIKSMRNKK